jgi:hypothetical protein
MNHGHIIVHQPMSFLPDREFYRCVAGYQGNAGSRDWRVFTDLADVSINIAPRTEPARARFNQYQSVPRVVSVGQISQTQSHGEDAQATRPA